MTRKSVILVVMFAAAAVAAPAPAAAQEAPRREKRKPKEIVVVGSKATATEQDATVSRLLAWAEKARKSKAFRTTVRSGRGTAAAPATGAVGRLSGGDPGAAELAPLVEQGRRLNDEILRTGRRMTRAQAQSYERRMRRLVGTMDRKTGKACNGKPKKGTLASCMCECDEAYQGWGGGKGWNRFVCKSGCIVAKTRGG